MVHRDHHVRIQVWHNLPRGVTSNKVLSGALWEYLKLYLWATGWNVFPGRSDGTTGDTVKWHHEQGTTVLPLEVELKCPWYSGLDLGVHSLMDACDEFFAGMDRSPVDEYVFWRITTLGLEETSPGYLQHSIYHGSTLSAPLWTSTHIFPPDVRMAMLISDGYYPNPLRWYRNTEIPSTEELYKDIYHCLESVFPCMLTVATSEGDELPLSLAQVSQAYAALFKLLERLRFIWTRCNSKPYCSLREGLKSRLGLRPKAQRDERKRMKMTRPAFILGPLTPNRRNPDKILEVFDAVIGLRLAFMLHLKYHDVLQLQEEVGPFEPLDLKRWGHIGYTLAQPDLMGWDVDGRRKFVWEQWVTTVERVKRLGQILFTRENFDKILDDSVDPYQDKWTLPPSPERLDRGYLDNADGDCLAVC